MKYAGTIVGLVILLMVQANFAPAWSQATEKTARIGLGAAPD